MRFWALASSLLVSAAAFPQAYGRFGTSELPPVPGFELEKSGFRVSEAAGDSFSFLEPLSGIQPVMMNDRLVELNCVGGVNGPKAIKVDLRSPGFMLRANENFRLTCRTLKTVFLTVDDATYQGQPTPRKPWVLVSFSDKQPPILFSFIDGESALRFDGKPGNYVVKFSPTYRGWVRVCLPFGQTPFNMDSGPAAAFGAAARRIKTEQNFWRAPMPRAVSQKVEAVENGIVATWQFAKPGTLVPTGILLAQSGGYGVKIQSPIAIAEGSLAQGPQGFCVGNELKVFFPVRPPLLTARPLTIGEVPKSESRGLAGLPSAWLAGTPDSILDAVQKTLPVAPTTPVSFVGAPTYDLPNLVKGTENALVEAITQGVGGAPVARPSLNRLIWRRDWYSLRLAYPDSAVVVKAQEQAAIAAWFTGDINKILEGCLLAAGTASAWAEPAYRTAFNFPSRPSVWSAKAGGLFQWIYRQKDAPDAFFASLTSPVATTDPRAVMVKERGKSYAVTWNHSSTDLKSIRFLSRVPVKFEAGANISALSIEVDGQENVLTYKPTKDGVCEILMTLPDGISLPITPSALDLVWK